MKQTLLMIVPLLVGVLLFSTCEEPTEPDTTPPTVTITSPQSGSTVSEVVSVTCISTDNEGVERVELWIDGVSTGITDNTEPYSMDWNTTTYENKSYTITIRSNDVNDNMTDSDPITLIVDNSGSYPQSISIISIVFGDGSFTITWNQSSDGDFASYDLEKSVESTMGDYDVVYSTEAVTDTTYVDSDVDPLSYQYYRITVIDTFGYETKGQIVSSSLDPVPTSVNVTSVTYTLSEMTVGWEESVDGDFRDYELLYSETESGDKNTVVTYTDKSTTSHIITNFDPTHENWFWVLVSDTLGQSSVGSGYMVIDNPPTPSELYPIVYENGSFIITWSQNNNDDFQSYTLYESLSEDMSGQTEIFTTNDNTSTSYTLSVNEWEYRYYQLIVQDVWGLQSVSNIEMGDSHNWFVKTFGGIDNDDGHFIENTSDGGYIIVGRTYSSGNGQGDIWLIKIDFYGNEEWNQPLGGSQEEVGRFIQQTTDGGYIITGNTESYGNGDGWDIWLVKTDSNGNLEWEKTFGDSGEELGYSVRQTTDGGFIIVGGKYVYNTNSHDVLLIKTDSQGNQEWSKITNISVLEGSMGSTSGISFQHTDDNGFIIVGEGLVKTDSEGNEEWIRNDLTGYSIEPTDGGGYIITGFTGEYPSHNISLIKIDDYGMEEWNKIFQGDGNEDGRSVQQTQDGGYVITGYTNSYGNGGFDVWLIKTDLLGGYEWSHSFGGSGEDRGRSVKQTIDGGYIITGYTKSFGNGWDDVWLIKTDPQGNTADYGD